MSSSSRHYPTARKPHSRGRLLVAAVLSSCILAMLAACNKRNSNSYPKPLFDDMELAAFDSLPAASDSLPYSENTATPTATSKHHSIPTTGSKSEYKATEVDDNMLDWDPNYEDPDNTHDMDYFMNSTDDEWTR